MRGAAKRSSMCLHQLQKLLVKHIEAALLGILVVGQGPVHITGLRELWRPPSPSLQRCSCSPEMHRERWHFMPMLCYDGVGMGKCSLLEACYGLAAWYLLGDS